MCLNVSETDVFQSFQTKEQCKVNHQLNCNDKCLIYLHSCKVCGLQYVGSTTYKFRLRWNNYKENNRKAKRGDEHIQPLFLSIFLQIIIRVSSKIAVLIVVVLSVFVVCVFKFRFHLS